MPEAYADDGNLVSIALPQEAQEATDPVEFVVYRVSRTGHEPAVRVARRRGELAVDHIPDCEVKPFSVEEPGKHVREFAVIMLLAFEEMACLQNADFHYPLFAQFGRVAS